eukprot:159444-Prymnesium_polylepis.1
MRAKSGVRRRRAAGARAAGDAPPRQGDGPMARTRTHTGSSGVLGSLPWYRNDRVSSHFFRKPRNSGHLRKKGQLRWSTRLMGRVP